MMLSLHRMLSVWLVAGWIVGFPPTTLWSQLPTEALIVDDEARQKEIAARFLSVLEQNPRRGTALDRVYRHHVEFGTLDPFLAQLRERTGASPEDGTAWMLLGLFEAHRGEMAKAIEAFRQAEALRPDDALASYYLAQSMLLAGESEDAVAALERALECKPARSDRLEIFQLLGRVHQRAQRTEQALAVWQRLEQMFPDDPRVQEQIAVAMVEDGQYALALPRYEQLAKITRDDYRRAMFQIEAAELKIREHRAEEGLDDLERILADLNPTGWLHQDVRHRIENVFLRTSDQDGLVNYYESWVGRHPEDVDAMSRLARFLASSGRMPEATAWMEKALQKAPNRVELRKAFIAQLVDDQRYSDAIKEYERLARSAPGDPDILREWGKLVLRDTSQDRQQRNVEATRIWNQIVAAHPNDAVTVAQVADLFRQAERTDEAIALYQKAIALAPDQPQYREYLGQYYHTLNRRDEALATWRGIAEGKRRTATNLVRLAEVYDTFGYHEAAATEITAACECDPKAFHWLILAADLHTRAQQFDRALEFIAAAERLAASDEEQDTVLGEKIEILQAGDRLADTTQRLATELAEQAEVTPYKWYTLARYYEASRNWQLAMEAIHQATAADMTNTRYLSTAARIAEQSGNLSQAAEQFRQLARTDRRSRGEYLSHVARLESLLGHPEDALQASRELIHSAPGKVENYELHAQLCFRMGERDEGLDTLRKAVRISQQDPHLIMALGAALADHFRTGEAIEVYWRAFEQADEISDKTLLTANLADLYLQLNQFDVLIARLERERREDKKRREMTICLAQAYHVWGDYGAARDELERLFHEESQDTNLLQQLSKLCEEGGDLDIAIEYQRRLAEIAPGYETEFRLAELLQQQGNVEEARDILVDLTQREEDPLRLLDSLDSLLSQGEFNSVIAITEPVLAVQRGDWELLYRNAVAWASLNQPRQAEERFRQLLALHKPYETLGTAARERQSQEERRTLTNRRPVNSAPAVKSMTPWTYVITSPQVRLAIGLDRVNSDRSPHSQSARIWMPDRFGLARMASYGWLLKLEQDPTNTRTEGESITGPSIPSVVDSFADVRSALQAGRRIDSARLYDGLFVELMQGSSDRIVDIARHLARTGDADDKRFFLSALSLRESTGTYGHDSTSPGVSRPQRPPLSDADLALMLDCYRDVSAADRQLDPATTVERYPSSRRSASGYLATPDYPIIDSAMILNAVVSQLELANRNDDIERLLDNAIEHASNARQFDDLMRTFFARKDLQRLDRLYRRYLATAKAGIARDHATRNSTDPRPSQIHGIDLIVQVLLQWMGRYGPEKKHAEVLAILDPALDLAIDTAQFDRVNPSSRGRSTSVPVGMYAPRLVVFYGKTPLYPSVDFPRPNTLVNMATLTLLRGAFEVFTRNGVVGDLLEHLRARVESSSPDDRPYNQLILGYALWWNDDQEEALEVLTRASEHFQDDATFQLEMGRLYDLLGDLDKVGQSTLLGLSNASRSTLPWIAGYHQTTQQRGPQLAMKTGTRGSRGGLRGKIRSGIY